MTEREFTELPTLNVEFLPKAHRYFMHKDDERISATSPTTILNSMVPKGPQYESWLRRVGFEQADLEMEQGANRGKMMHTIMQEYCESRLVPRLSDFDVSWHPWVAGVCSWLVEAAPEPILTEQTVASWDLRLAGRFDLLALIDGVPTICDLKTRNRIRHDEKDHMQIAAYQRLLAETFPEYGPVCGLIVQVDKEANVEPEECVAVWEDFESILNAHRRVSALKKALKPAKASA